MTAGTLKDVFDSEISNARFNMPRLSGRATDALAGTIAFRQFLSVAAALGDRASTYAFRAALRTAFLIELVKEDVKTTKFAVRWTTRLNREDPRYASFDVSFEVFEHLMNMLSQAVQDTIGRELLGLMTGNHQLAYELPIDYLERNISLPLHRAENLSWIEGDLPERVLRLRALLLDRETNPQAPFFAAAYEKIRVKSYLTDRAQTGEYKTNREKRWETHPAGVQFALRRDCMEVEYSLLNQLCHFEGFDDTLRKRLEDAGLLPSMDVPFRCPVTMDPLSFVEFEREVMIPEHGKANFHVGHLNPLKATNDDPRSGHTAQNISWITSDGNRIQGHLSLRETRQLLDRIRANYEEAQEG